MAITCLTILWATLLVVSAHKRSSDFSSTEEEYSGTPVIENKNVNIIVNVNAQELAQELWKIIEARLNNETDHLTSSKSVMKDLEDAVIPLMSPSRRGISPSAYQVASHLDKITRRALTRDSPGINMLDEEIMARDIVADMMASLKIFLSKQTQLKTGKKDSPGRRMLHSPVVTTSYDNEQDDYMNVIIKIHRRDILDALQ